MQHTMWSRKVQVYSSFKKAEHGMKAVRYDGRSISVVDPKTYAERFMAFMRREAFCGGERRTQDGVSTTADSGPMASATDSAATSVADNGVNGVTNGHRRQ